MDAESNRRRPYLLLRRPSLTTVRTPGVGIRVGWDPLRRLTYPDKRGNEGKTEG